MPRLGYLSKCSLGKIQNKVEKKYERDEFQLFVKESREMARGNVEAACNSEGRPFHNTGAV